MQPSGAKAGPAPPLNRVMAAAGIAACAVLVYAASASYGLFADDFQWLVSAGQFDAARLFGISDRDHFFRPAMDAYFPAALAICGRDASCYHWLNIALHASTSVLVAAMAASMARRGAVGLLAGVLFAVQSGPTEAVVWVSAATELLSTAFFVLTIWLFHRGSAFGVLSFVASLLAHESGVVVLPVIAALVWTSRLRWTRLLPYIAVVAAYAPMAAVISARNYVVDEGQYGLGAHILSNIFHALGSFAATGGSLAGTIVVGALTAWAIAGGPSRVRFYAVWMLLALLPFAGFREGFASRYTYLGAVGFACAVAEALWAVREKWGLSPFVALALAVTVRSAVFASKNVRPWERAGAPYVEYARAMRAAHPSPQPGSTLDAPRPLEFSAHYVPALLQWEYGDLTLRVNVID